MDLEVSFLAASLVGVTTLVAIYYLLTSKENRYPPGPVTFPYIGNLPQLMLAGSLPSFAEQYKKQYGNVSYLIPPKVFPIWRTVNTW